MQRAYEEVAREQVVSASKSEEGEEGVDAIVAAQAVAHVSKVRFLATHDRGNTPSEKVQRQNDEEDQPRTCKMS